MKVVLVSPNASRQMGGEAIKAFQYFEYLLGTDFDAYLITHSRCRDELEGLFPANRLIFVEDGFWQALFWRSGVLSFLITVYFHLVAAKLIQAFEQDTTIVHYLCPISPVQLRFPPKGYDIIMGPFSGAIHFPPAFRGRMPLIRRLNEKFHQMSQWILGYLVGDKKKARVVLVSGYERTHRSLLAAGCQPERLIDVVDSGVPDSISNAERIRHAGVSGRFICSCRLINLKGIDLAIRALAFTPETVSLTICGDGPERAALESIVDDLGLSKRVDFKGWLDHSQLLQTLRGHRGFVFPSLADANGIAVQEAMMIGLPVIALRWGGPAHLADDTSAWYVDPTSEDAVINGLAQAMTKLSADGEKADQISAAARKIAESRFTWKDVAASWSACYKP